MALVYILGIISGVVLVAIALGGWILAAAHSLKERTDGKALPTRHKHADASRLPVEVHGAGGPHLRPINSSRIA